MGRSEGIGVRARVMAGVAMTRRDSGRKFMEHIHNIFVWYETYYAGG